MSDDLRCRYDSDTGTYQRDGETCRRDEYGLPVKHCTARRTCANHIGLEELTCPRCLHRTRTDLRTILVRYADLVPEAVAAGVNSEAMVLLGPATDVEAWSWHKVAAKQGRIWHVSLIEDDDEFHPVTVVSVWCRMLAEDYGLDCPDLSNLTTAAAFLDRMLHRVAQDDGQDFPLLARELRRCRSHLESVLRDSQQPERGAPCPECRDAGHLVRMVREYPHYCDSPDCEQVHYETDEADVWVCPKNREHWRTHEDYLRWVEERTSA